MALSEAVRRLTGDLRQAHLGRMGSVTMLRGDAARHRADLRSDLRDMAGTLARGFGDADATRRAAESARRTEMARAARRRDAHLDRVRASVASTRTATASMLKALRDDVREAHRAWSEFGAFARTARVAAPGGTPADAGGSLFETVLRLLGERPTGMRLGELQKALELPRRQVARLMDELVAARKAKLDKQGTYFKRQ